MIVCATDIIVFEDKKVATLFNAGFILNHLLLRLISTLLKLEISSFRRVEISNFRRVEISKQTNAKADDSNYRDCCFVIPLWWPK